MTQLLLKKLLNQIRKPNFCWTKYPSDHVVWTLWSHGTRIWAAVKQHTIAAIVANVPCDCKDVPLVTVDFDPRISLFCSTRIPPCLHLGSFIVKSLYFKSHRSQSLLVRIKFRVPQLSPHTFQMIDFFLEICESSLIALLIFLIDQFISNRCESISIKFKMIFFL